MKGIILTSFSFEASIEVVTNFAPARSVASSDLAIGAITFQVTASVNVHAFFGIVKINQISLVNCLWDELNRPRSAVSLRFSW